MEPHHKFFGVLIVDYFGPLNDATFHDHTPGIVRYGQGNSLVFPVVHVF